MHCEIFFLSEFLAENEVTIEKEKKKQQEINWREAFFSFFFSSIISERGKVHLDRFYCSNFGHFDPAILKTKNNQCEFQKV